MKILILLLLLTTLCTQMINAHRAQPNKVIEPVAAANTPAKFPTLTTEKIPTTAQSNFTNSKNCTEDETRSSNEPLLIDSYLAPSMQALAYYIELLQYEPAAMTTLEPPFSGWEAEGGTTYKPPPTPPRPSTTTTTKTSTVWWKPPSTQSTIWWVPPSTTKRTTTVRPSTTTQTTTKTTTKKPWYTTQATTQYADRTEMTTQWWQTTTTKKPITTSTVPSTTQTWWQPPSWWTTSKKPLIITTTIPPETTPYHRPGVFAPQITPLSPSPIRKPPVVSIPKPSTASSSSSSSSSSTSPAIGIGFASNYRPQFTSLNHNTNNKNQNNQNKLIHYEKRAATEQLIRPTTKRFPKASIVGEIENGISDERIQNVDDNISSGSGSDGIRSSSSNKIKSTLLSESQSTQSESHSPQTGSRSVFSHPFDKDFYSWFTQQKKAKIYKADYEYDFQLLDPLPGALIRDILLEKSELPAITDMDNINEFLKIYDDNFGRLNSITGKKRIPITKPYVEFLMLYDMLKRDAKAMNLSKYEGYSEEMLYELAELSQRSAERQLHALLTRMLLRNDIDRSDTISRVKGIIKDLETPTSITAKAMRYFPPLLFVP